MLLVALPLLTGLAATAQAQPRDFKCIGAERLEDDVFEVAFPAHSARPSTAARTPVAAAAALAVADPTRNICVLGHATREGGQATTTELAARRAREVAEMLAVGQRIDRDRIRAEARNPGFSRRTENREARSVTIVVLPAPLGTAPPAAAARPATPAAERPAAPAATRPAAPAAERPAAPAAERPVAPAAERPAAPRDSVPAAPPAVVPAPAAPPATTPPVPPAEAPAKE
jgi:hypothetical protein